MADGVTLAVALGAGLASFFAPCVLPVVPGYLAFVTGGPAAGRAQRALLTLVFVGGFGAAFVALGTLVGAVGSSPTFQAAEGWLQRLGGLLIIVFGLAMTGLLRLPWLNRDVRYHGRLPDKTPRVVAAGTLGAAFAVGWSPCVGPILASILILAGGAGGAAEGATLLGVYAAGLAVPFLALGLTAERGAAFLRRHSRATRWVEVAGGTVLILLGVFVFTGSVARLTSYVPLPGV